MPRLRTSGMTMPTNPERRPSVDLGGLARRLVQTPVSSGLFERCRTIMQ